MYTLNLPISDMIYLMAEFSVTCEFRTLTLRARSSHFAVAFLSVCQQYLRLCLASSDTLEQ
jgi:hypothetical protein